MQDVTGKYNVEVIQTWCSHKVLKTLGQEILTSQATVRWHIS